MVVLLLSTEIEETGCPKCSGIWPNVRAINEKPYRTFRSRGFNGPAFGISRSVSATLFRKFVKQPTPRAAISQSRRHQGPHPAQQQVAFSDLASTFPASGKRQCGSCGGLRLTSATGNDILRRESSRRRYRTQDRVQ